MLLLRYKEAREEAHYPYMEYISIHGKGNNNDPIPRALGNVWQPIRCLVLMDVGQ